jgi:hypothetical protein
MVAITTLTAYSPSLHTGGSAAQQSAPANAGKTEQPDAPATVVTLSDHAQMLVAEANAAQLAADLFAIANGVAARGESDAPGPASTQVVVAHDVQANEGLYIVWSSVR